MWWFKDGHQPKVCLGASMSLATTLKLDMVVSGCRLKQQVQVVLGLLDAYLKLIYDHHFPPVRYKERRGRELNYKTFQYSRRNSDI